MPFLSDKGEASGRAKGGLARAKALRPEERRAIAQAAAQARWKRRPRPDGTFAVRRLVLQVPAPAAADLRLVSQKLWHTYRRAAAFPERISAVLATINAPLPIPIDACTLVHCLTTLQPEEKWRPHIESLFEEVPIEAIHDLVLAGIVTFEDLYLAARRWSIKDGETLQWVKEMADFRLARTPS